MDDDKMLSRLRAVEERVDRERLPNWEAVLASGAQIWIAEQGTRARSAIRDNDEVLFERALGNWTKGWERVNETLAEEYRVTNADPELWELRYIKWMKKVLYIKFGCPLGDFYLVPRKPRKKPRAKHWYTVDEMLDMLDPTIAATIKTFKQLPIRSESLEGPLLGEKHMQIDITSGKPVIKYTFQGGISRVRKTVR